MVVHGFLIAVLCETRVPHVQWLAWRTMLRRPTSREHSTDALSPYRPPIAQQGNRCMKQFRDGRTIAPALLRVALLMFAASPLVICAQNIDLVNATVVDGTGAAPRTRMAVTV